MLQNMEFTAKKSIPVYRQIAAHLRDGIMTGKWRCEDKLPSENELATAFGVNRLTLRKSLRMLEDEKLVIQRHGSGTFVTYGGTAAKYRIGLLISLGGKLEENPYISKVLLGVIQGELNRSAAELRLLELNETDTEVTLAHKISDCDGLIVPGPLVSHIPVLCAKRFSRLPMICLSTSDAKLLENGKICLDLQPDSMATAVNELKKQGKNKIAYLGVTMGTNSFLDRTNCFMAMRERGDFYCPESYIKLFRGNLFDESREFMHHLIAGGDIPDAVLSNTSAYGVLFGAVEKGLRVPQDITVIGFDGHSAMCPMLRNLVQPTGQMAADAYKLLTDILDSGKLPETRLYRYNAQLI